MFTSRGTSKGESQSIGIGHRKELADARSLRRAIISSMIFFSALRARSRCGGQGVVSIANDSDCFFL
jgi:hypothetical protein